VHASLAVPDGRLEMAGWGADMNPRGWAHYVRDLTGRYDVRDRNSLIDNSLVLGSVPSTTIQEGAFTFHLALLGPAAAGRADVEGALGAVVREFVRST
jgi:hypothetical protein